MQLKAGQRHHRRRRQMFINRTGRSSRGVQRSKRRSRVPPRPTLPAEVGGDAVGGVLGRQCTHLFRSCIQFGLFHLERPLLKNCCGTLHSLRRAPPTPPLGGKEAATHSLLTDGGCGAGAPHLCSRKPDNGTTDGAGKCSLTEPAGRVGACKDRSAGPASPRAQLYLPRSGAMLSAACLGGSARSFFDPASCSGFFISSDLY